MNQSNRKKPIGVKGDHGGYLEFFIGKKNDLKKPMRIKLDI